MSASAIPISARLAVGSAKTRVDERDWDALATELDGYGCAVMTNLLTPDECAEIAALYPHEDHFRSHIHRTYPGPDLAAWPNPPRTP